MIPTLGPSPIVSAVNLAPMLLLLDGLLSLTKYTEAAECARWFGASLPLISATANCNTAKKTGKTITEPSLFHTPVFLLDERWISPLNMYILQGAAISLIKGFQPGFNGSYG